MSKEKVISYKNRLPDPISGKLPTHIITKIHIDNVAGIIEIVYTKGFTSNFL